MGKKITREERLKRYQELYGEHHPICTCPQCLEIRRKEPKLRTFWRLIMFGTAAKAPKVYVREKDKYICPHCLEETLVYDEKERLFICSKEKCIKKYALAEVE